jgi:dihydrofolate reductase
MRRLIVSALVSLDGVQSDPRSWASAYFDEEATEEALAGLLRAEAMLMGRGTYEYFAPAWPQTPGPYAARLNAMKKYVFSETLTSAEWNNAEIIRGKVPEAVSRLKEQDGADLIIYGFGQLAHNLLAHDLVDTLNISVHPIILGEGSQNFPRGDRFTLSLSEVESHATGVVSLTYTR